MQTIAKLTLASVLVLLIGATVQAQNAQQGDYYRFQPWMSQQASPAQEQRIQQGDYYKRGTRHLRNSATPAQERRMQQGDYYRSSK